MQKHKGNIRINKAEYKGLQLALNPDKKYLDKSVADDLSAQFSNSECYRTTTFPCVLKFNSAASATTAVQAYTMYHGNNAPSNEQMFKDFFAQPYDAYLSADGTIHHEHLVSAVNDLLYTVLMYY